MAQTTRDLSEALSGTVYTNKIDDIIESLDTCHSGATAPTDTVANGKMWLDTTTTPAILKVYNNSAWTIIATEDGSFAHTGTVDLTGTIVENVFTVTGTTPTVNPSNGSIQTWTLTGASTLSLTMAEGEALTLMIDDGTANTLTWPTITWVNNGGATPPLATTGYTVVTLWKVSTTIYGSLVGDGT